MTGSPINATSLATLKIGYSVEFISIDVIIVAKCASMLYVAHFLRGRLLDPLLYCIEVRGSIMY